MMNIKNSCINTNLIFLFRAKAQFIFGPVAPRSEDRGNSNKSPIVIPNAAKHHSSMLSKYIIRI
jgi:hypothetical protein